MWWRQGQLSCRGGSVLGVSKAHQFPHQQAADACSVAGGSRAGDASASEAAVPLPSSGTRVVESETLHCFKSL